MPFNSRYIIPFLLLLSIPVVTLAQEDLLEKSIKTNLQGLSLPEALNRISTESGIKFSFSTSLVKNDYRVRIRTENMKISQFLSEILDEYKLEYLLVEEQIVIRKKVADLPEKMTVDEKKQRHILSGYISDESSGESLIGATVYISEMETGAITNAYGFYSITLEEGWYNIGYSYVGYTTHSYPVELFQDVKNDIQLAQKAARLAEVTIEVNQDELAFERLQTGELKLEPKSLVQMPSLFGENDVIKSLQTIPGINLFGDGSTLFFVRGGNKDQNLILIDEAPIYNPSHMLGFFSSFIPEAINDIRIYKGDFPAQFGGRLSSLIDIKTREGNMKRLMVSASAGVIAAKAAVEGPIIKDKSSFFISGRRSWFGWLPRLADPGIRDLWFSDFNSKLNIRLNDKNRLFLSAYLGKDYFSQSISEDDASGISWENAAGTIRWNHLFNDRLFANTTLYSSKYDYFFITSVSNNDHWKAHIANISLKTDMSWYPNSNNTIRFGGRLSGHNFNPGNFYFSDPSLAGYFPIVSIKNAQEASLYLSNEQQAAKKITLRYGLRMSTWTNTGEATEYLLDSDYLVYDTVHYSSNKPYHSYLRFEPRLGITCRLGLYSSIKGGYSRTNQFIQLVTNSISPFTTLEVWLPSGPNIKPQSANQYTLGYFRKYRESGVHFSLELYYKSMRNQIEYVDHAHLLLNPFLESELRFGTAQAYGLETQLSRSIGKFTGWIAYSLSKINRQTKGINEGQTYPASWDRPHDFSLLVSYEISPRWILGMNLIYMSGSSFSSPAGFYDYNGYTIPIYNERNNDRFPAYHRMDLSAKLMLNKRDQRYRHDISLSIYNFYGHKNPFSVNFSKIHTGENEFRIPGNLYSRPDIVPTQRFLIGFIPSLTYNLSF